MLALLIYGKGIDVGAKRPIRKADPFAHLHDFIGNCELNGFLYRASAFEIESNDFQHCSKVIYVRLPSFVG